MNLMKRAGIVAMCCVAVLSLQSQAQAEQVLVLSNFDSGHENWRLIDNSDWGYAHHTGGTIEFSNKRNIGGRHAGYLKAPSKFLGDWSAAIGGTLSYRFRAKSVQYSPTNDITIWGGGSAMTYDFAIGTSWQTHEAKFRPGQGWKVGGQDATRAQIQTILSDITQIYVMGEYGNWSHPQNNLGYLDDFMFVSSAPTPSAFGAAMVIGSFVIFRKVRSKLH